MRDSLVASTSRTAVQGTAPATQPIEDAQATLAAQWRTVAYLRGAIGTEELDWVYPGELDAKMVELGFETSGPSSGFGLRVTARDSDVGYLGGVASFEGGSAFAHLTLQPTHGAFRMPVRIGPEVLSKSFNFQRSNKAPDDAEFLSVGGAIEIEPTFEVVRSNGSTLSVYGRGHFGMGRLNNSGRSRLIDESSNTAAEVGLRWQAQRFSLSGGYMRQETDYNGSGLLDYTWKFEGIFLSLGVRF